MPWIHQSGKQSDMSPEYHRNSSAGDKGWTWHQPPPAQQSFSNIPAGSPHLPHTTTFVASGRPLTHGEKLFYKTLGLAALALTFLFYRGYLVMEKGHVVTALPAAHSNNTTIYQAIDINIRSLFNWSPIVDMQGNVVVEGSLWHVIIDCFSCGTFAVNGDVNYSEVGVSGVLSVRGASHSMIGGSVLLQTHGLVSNTTELGAAIENLGSLGDGNEIKITALDNPPPLHRNESPHRARPH